MNEIFNPAQDIEVRGKPAFVCGKLRQLLRVCARPIFTFKESETMEGFMSLNLWCKFRLVELDQVMPQKDETF